jgi:ABC-2 type transport system ATP-binding protein
MPTLEVRSLTKWYGPIRGIEEVSFALERGEIFGYLGPNGAGKTTTLRCIMGLIRPGGGEVLALGEPVVAGRATQHDRIGYLPGEFRLWPGLIKLAGVKERTGRPPLIQLVHPVGLGLIQLDWVGFSPAAQDWPRSSGVSPKSTAAARDVSPARLNISR